MSLKTTVVLSFAMLGALAFAAPVAAIAAGGSAIVKAVDKDNDGTISLDEAKAAALAKFDAMDMDHDGTLDAKEAKAGMVKKLDTDKDGTVDKTEFAAAVEAAFKKADPDNDGTVDAKELSSPAGTMLARMITIKG